MGVGNLVMQLIWHKAVESHYDCSVVRAGPRTDWLKLVDVYNMQVLIDVTVPLSYNAIPTVDHSDVEQWNSMITDALGKMESV